MDRRRPVGRLIEATECAEREGFGIFQMVSAGIDDFKKDLASIDLTLPLAELYAEAMSKAPEHAARFSACNFAVRLETRLGTRAWFNIATPNATTRDRAEIELVQNCTDEEVKIVYRALEASHIFYPFNFGDWIAEFHRTHPTWAIDKLAPIRWGLSGEDRLLKKCLVVPYWHNGKVARITTIFAGTVDEHRRNEKLRKDAIAPVAVTLMNWINMVNSRVDVLYPLSKAEIEVLHWSALGKQNEEIAEIMNIKVRTVTHHMDQIMNRKLHVPSRVAAVALSIQLGLIHPFEELQINKTLKADFSRISSIA